MKETRKHESKMMPNEIQKNYAKELRKKMKNHFPSTKISVRCDLRAIHISWNNGPTAKEVMALIPEHRKISTDKYGNDVFRIGTYYHSHCRYITN